MMTNARFRRRENICRRFGDRWACPHRKRGPFRPMHSIRGEGPQVTFWALRAWSPSIWSGRRL